MIRPNLARILVDEALERGRGQEAALREPKRVWSYAKLADESGRAGSALTALGVKPGERIALFLHDSAELAATFLGALRIGAVPVPLSVLSRQLEVRAQLADAGAVAVVVNADLAPTVEAVRGELPALRHVLAVGGARPGQDDFHALTREAEADCPVFEPPEGAPAFILYSAGPSGHKKGVAHGHEAPRRAFESYARAILALDERDRVFTTSSLASAYGLGIGLFFPLQAGACTFLLPARPRPRTIFHVMSAFDPTIFAAAPSLYGQLVHDWRALAPPRPVCFQSVRHAISGGEAMPVELERRISATFGIKVLHGFGATEALHFVLSNRPGATREGSVGTPLPGYEARVVGESGAALPAQEIGTLEVRGPTCESWVRPGDRFFIDEDGYYFHCGRTDDLFKVSGRWVAPEEVERTLLAHPAVWECAVVEGHDEDGLARPIAFVVPNVGHPPSDELAEELIAMVKREIAPYKYPRRIEFVDALPKSADGQVQRWRLRPGDAERS
ncbi:MAG TPA: benzoate-CoA ligase family protein [Polyangia bacterium]